MQHSLNDVVFGAVVQVSLSIKNMTNVLADPSAIRFLVKLPDSSVVTYVYGVAAEFVKDSVGNYHIDLVMNQSGTWVYRWETDSPNGGADEGVVKVNKSNVI